MFGLGKKNFLGIDIGTSSVKIIELGKKGKERVLENYGEAGIYFKGQDFKGDNDISSNSRNTAEIIFSICKEMETKEKEASFSVPDFCTFITNLQVPAINRKEIPETIKYEVRPYVPLPISEISLDWIVINGEPGKTKIEILVAAIPNDIIAQYQEISKLSGLKLRFLEPEAFALARAAYWSGYQGVVGLVDIGSKSTTCSIMENGVIKMSFSFNIAGNEITERLARSFNIDYNKAEEMKRSYGLLEAKDNGEMKKILSYSIDLIIEEVKKVLRNFYSEKGKEADKIIITGGIAWLPGLKDYFKNEIKKEILILNPFSNILHPGQLNQVLEKKGPFYSIAAGLALRGLE